MGVLESERVAEGVGLADGGHVTCTSTHVDTLAATPAPADTPFARLIVDVKHTAVGEELDARAHSCCRVTTRTGITSLVAPEAMVTVDEGGLIRPVTVVACTTPPQPAHVFCTATLKGSVTDASQEPEAIVSNPRLLLLDAGGVNVTPGTLPVATSCSTDVAGRQTPATTVAAWPARFSPVTYTDTIEALSRNVEPARCKQPGQQHERQHKNDN